MSEGKVPLLRCPMCGDGKLVERVNKETGGHFMACTNWDDGAGCKHTAAVPSYVRLIQQGAEPLPGFES